MARDRFRYLRDALAEDLAEAPCGRIRRTLGRDLADELEEIAGAAHDAAHLVRQAAPGALKGAAAGFLVGGPAGAVVGGALGAAGVAVPRPAASATTIANPAALELLLTVLRPEIVEALLALALGRQGARAVPVGGVPVPVATAANLVQSLAEQASAAHLEPRMPRVPRYLAEAHARREDLDSPAVRAESLRALLHESASLEVEEEEGLEDDFEDEIDRVARRRDLLDIHRLGGLDP